MNNDVCIEKNIYLCRTKFEAIHNKDYSVVKTFRAGPQSLVLSLYTLCFGRIQHIPTSPLANLFAPIKILPARTRPKQCS